MAKEENKYGINDIASELGITAEMARIRLRRHKIEKDGKSYSWSTKSQVADVVKQLGEKAAKADKKAAAPAKATVAKKGAKAAPKKAAKPAAKSGKKAAQEQAAA